MSFNPGRNSLANSIAFFSKGRQSRGLIVHYNPDIVQILPITG
jgi:hypothetical protein